MSVNPQHIQIELQIELPAILKAIDVAQVFNVSAHTVRQWVRDGQLIVGFRTPGGHARFHRSDVVSLRQSLAEKGSPKKKSTRRRRTKPLSK